ncbi:MAG: phosphoribosylanthranilate isomerase [Pseudomonadales bacterium]
MPVEPNAGARQRTRVKICGITSVVDAHAAVAAGADALGFVFYEPSPRAVSASDVNVIVAQMPPFVTVVGLFVNPSKEYVSSVLGSVRLDVLQFHGDEAPDFARQFGLPYYSVLRVGEMNSVERSKMDQHVEASGFLFDTFDQSQAGGTGKTFDWSQFDSGARGAILAGGLTPENVATAITTVRPYAVDVSSGVELSPGKKDAAKMNAFINECQRADLLPLQPSIDG